MNINNKIDERIKQRNKNAGNNSTVQQFRYHRTKIFDDRNYAWQLLEAQVKLETSDNISGQDISQLLQLYMRGVEKMNSLMDIRESFFKNKVTSLMSRPTVIRNLNKPMGKKSTHAEVDTSSPTRKLDTKTQMHLKEKRKQMEMRMAYGAEENNPDAMRKLMAEHASKQSLITQKIQKMIDSNQQRLMKRIKERKLRTMTAKSRSDILADHEEEGEFIRYNAQQKKQIMEKMRDQEQFGIPIIKEQTTQQSHKNVNSRKISQNPLKIFNIKEQNRNTQQTPKKNNKGKKKFAREYRSLSPPRCKFEEPAESSSKRRISVDFNSGDCEEFNIDLKKLQQKE